MSEKRYPPVLKALKKYYGYDQFRPGQPELIKALLDGRDVLGIMPTGAGKSVCFQIPAIFMPGITLVISPLISLMQDQVAALLQAHIPAAYLNSSLTFAQYKKALYFAKQGRYKIIYVAPERLNTPGFLDFAQSVDISMIAIDEAHCVSQWGQNFRPSYLEISKFANSLKKRPIMAAFTATATGPVKADMLRLLELKNPKVLVTGFDRKNLYFEVQKPRNKFAALENFLEKHSHESGIIYCLTRKETEEVCDRLNEQGFLCTRYHAGLSLEERAANQEAFLYDKVPLIAATNAFGMGIDKSNVRFVVHYSMPSSLENYYQEAGRAGRDGAPAHCLLLYSGSDLMTNKFLIERSNEETENEDQKRRELHRLNQMQGYCTTPMCLRSYILQYFGENSSGHCSNCSNCTSEWITEDITEPAQQIAEAIRRLPRAYGITMMIDFLKGKDIAKLRKSNLTSVPGFGALHTLSDEKIRMVLEGLLIQGYLTRSVDQYQVISSTQKLALALKNNEKIVFQRKASLEDRKKKKKEKTTPSGSASSIELFEKLKTVRRQLATKYDLPPYLIFSDATLLSMAQKLPTDEDSLLEVSGVGAFKLERYGKAFLTAIKAHIDQQNQPEDKLKKEIANNSSSNLSSYTKPDPDDTKPDPDDIKPDSEKNLPASSSSANNSPTSAETPQIEDHTQTSDLAKQA
ncbi:DNA helicase RecQ [Allobaculum sp. JKK-2023]|uniref:DNA helicase RecQ n=1 Tax=Allobaculum sp. JKK-2023 TaxID=3108943 RepID=UPI002B05BD6D|nr:DNA helicase RecQ [Allobaculum sp. JKK-2023]